MLFVLKVYFLTSKDSLPNFKLDSNFRILRIKMVLILWITLYNGPLAKQYISPNFVLIQISTPTNKDII